jgi:predicted HAD superfamily Cof-like phosphohydrolase
MKDEKDYPLIPMSEITDEARRIAVAWMECEDKNWIGQKHKLASDIMNYAKKYHASVQPTAPVNLRDELKQVIQLKEFHKAFGLPQRDKPEIIPIDEFAIRTKLIFEELDELSEAYYNNDIVEVADAITDIMYVLIGTALQFGIANKLVALFDEVHRSNMSKLDEKGNPVMREDGKVMKSNLYTRPNLQPILQDEYLSTPSAKVTEIEPANKYCPCLVLDEPCKSNCSCKNPLSSAGCNYCATYGSIEQRKAMAKFIKSKIDFRLPTDEDIEKWIETEMPINTDDELDEEINKYCRKAVRLFAQAMRDNLITPKNN